MLDGTLRVLAGLTVTDEPAGGGALAISATGKLLYNPGNSGEIHSQVDNDGAIELAANQSGSSQLLVYPAASVTSSGSFTIGGGATLALRPTRGTTMIAGGSIAGPGRLRIDESVGPAAPGTVPGPRRRLPRGGGALDRRALGTGPPDGRHNRTARDVGRRPAARVGHVDGDKRRADGRRVARWGHEDHGHRIDQRRRREPDAARRRDAAHRGHDDVVRRRGDARRARRVGHMGERRNAQRRQREHRRAASPT